MFDDSQSFVTRAFLRAELDIDYKAYVGEGEDDKVLTRVRAWDARLQLKETQAEGAFTQTFFVETWGYRETGRAGAGEHTIIPQFRVAGEGAGGGAGAADLALGWFRGSVDEIPQVLCEFKDIRTKLDAKQPRKGSNRSPVEQCLNYLRGARRGMFGNEPVQPWWGLVTDMNEFRLYWWDRAPGEYMRFVIRREADLFAGDYDLRSDGDDARFDRFLFWKLLQRDMLLSPAGRPPLLRLIERQWVKERALEGEFYAHYKGVRERLFNTLVASNANFAGTKTELLRISQALLDRFIFAFYCEDMGERILFPPQLLRDMMKGRSTDAYFDPSGQELWEQFKGLFRKMNTGGELGNHRVPHINGGLFAENPTIDGLRIPNDFFAAPKQGAGSEAALESDDSTLLYLCARYNYAARGNAKESLSLYTLGRIFEQSITELEYRVGELENRETLAALSKRKRDGVYYTPEWVVNMLVDGTLDPWFAAQRAKAGYPAKASIPPTRAAVTAYRERLRIIRVVDPACGSGAFLISAFRKLLDERMAVERELERARGSSGEHLVEESAVIGDILASNIFGVDINPASVEIAKLALWLHSARAKAPLSSLDGTIRCGNSLVGPDYWRGRERDAEIAEEVNAFDWAAAFPQVFAGGGFDIVLGNPPYVKLQNLMKVDPNIVAYLQAGRGDDTYLSAQTGNTDLYLPFIEKGLRLLAPGGRMAYIAPSLWTVNQYGEGLRRLVRQTRQLERWLDFKAHQIFDEAITYTALQFFTREANDALSIAAAPKGETQARDTDWSAPALKVDWEAMPADGEWLMATGAERALIDRLARDCMRLDDPRVTSGITVGIQTSADSIYHLRRLGRGRYLCAHKKGEEFEVVIEDAIMKPLVSGPEAKRYEEPETDTYLLFPYEREAGGAMRLIPQADMEKRFPQAWAYLKSFEKELRKRESGKFDGEKWYQFGRSQNLDKQDRTKLVVAQLVPGMRVCADNSGDKYLNNVRVNGIFAASDVDQHYLLGVLNGRVADFVFKQIGKPKQGGWYEANKQFIAPLPVPGAGPAEQAEIAAMARRLQDGWTRRRELLSATGERLGVLARARHPARWLWPDIPQLSDVVERAPRALKHAADRREWAKRQVDEAEAAELEALRTALAQGGELEAGFAGGELSLLSGGAPILSRIYLDDDAGRLAQSYWTWLLLTDNGNDAGRFAAELRRPPVADNAPAARQFAERVGELQRLVADIALLEAEMETRLSELYRLDDEEQALVDRSGR
jgi:hypothetical protein